MIILILIQKEVDRELCPVLKSYTILVSSIETAIELFIIKLMTNIKVKYFEWTKFLISFSLR
jgi:hypothetical protein